MTSSNFAGYPATSLALKVGFFGLAWGSQFVEFVRIQAGCDDLTENSFHLYR